MSFLKTIVNNPKRSASLMAATVALVIGFEGMRETPYLDPVGIPTVCAGHTGGVHMDRVYTPTECEELMAGDLGHAFDVVESSVKVPIGDATKSALASFVFNVGQSAFVNSTLLLKLNRGAGPAACDELLRWVWAKGRKLPGLVNRRAKERELCIAGFGNELR